jgi:hypothetical protein
MQKTLVFFLLILLVFSCKKDFEGDALKQAPPETFVVVDKIIRSGPNRLNTTVEAHWWGYSEKGIVKGFEVSTDNKNTWKYTTEQQGTFLLTLPPGADTANIAIFIRAVDNIGQFDLTPASTLYPIKNTPPKIAFDYANGQKKTSFPAFRIYWNASDTDGVEDLAQIDIAFNDTTSNIYSLPANVNAITIVSDDIFSGKFFVYTNSKTTPQSNTLSGVIFDQKNYYYIRSVDRASSKSKWVRDSITIRKPKSNFLLINDYTSSKNIVQSFYTRYVDSCNIPASVQESILSSKDELPNDIFTTTKVFNYFKRIVWVSNDGEGTLSLAQLSTVDFFSNGGKMLLAIDFGGTFSATSPYLSFTPATNLVSYPAGTDLRMTPGDTIFNLQSGYPLLTYSGSSTSNAIRPFEQQNSSSLFVFDSLYKCQLTLLGGTGSSPWSGNSLTVSKRRKTGDAKANLIFSTIPLHLCNGGNNAAAYMRKFLNDDLGF